METEAILTIVSAILTLISAFAGAKWQKAKTKANKISELLAEILDAAKDDKVTEKEFQAIADKVIELKEDL